MKSVQYKLLILMLSGILISCDENLVDSNVVTFNKTEWPANDPAVFQLEPVDTINDYGLFLSMRNNQDYAYKNLWLITQMKFPQGKVVTDTLEYNMADARGAFLGRGKDIVENKLVYQRGFRFRESGTYQLTVKQAMRKSGSSESMAALEGVLDIGYTVEKETKDGSN